ncbi:MAG: murein transglycosylase A [Symploca sp. SIO1C4]|uniref:peptidoglycan lytic exotransglycosylase n=1 Tax=Symploca sp. SIO1C4 TaxID=2607765 RepID=A0A6B3NGP0_9CYAN|nr:murein transglycosylase A [Symploca sp. SIO1C4]
MKKTITWLSLSLAMALLSINTSAVAKVPLQLVNPESTQINLDSLGLDEQLWEHSGQLGDKQALLDSIDNSLRYLATPSAAKAYQEYPVQGITRNRVHRSLIRFRQLVVNSNSPAQLQAAVNREFALYKSVGQDNQGTVFFTGYFEPIYNASWTPSAKYRYPLYRRPANFEQWQQPHPTRAELEGEDGLGIKSPLRGRELVWLSDRLEAFLVHIQGSARLRMPDGSLISVGYAGKTNYPYTSIGRELVKDGILPLDGLTLPVLIDYFNAYPKQLSKYLPRNQSFVFFKETYGAPATGSIGVPVTAERSIATDKSLMPPGALALIHTRIPYPNANGKLEYRLVSRYVLDQDTGSAIRGPGRVDIFMGTGSQAGDRAGIIGGRGGLYYLLLKN